jgi:hypothetical protein
MRCSENLKKKHTTPPRRSEGTSSEKQSYLCTSKKSQRWTRRMIQSQPRLLPRLLKGFLFQSSTADGEEVSRLGDVEFVKVLLGENSHSSEV